MARNAAQRAVVCSAVRHAPLLHELQCQFPAVRDVRYNFQETDVAIAKEQTEKDHQEAVPAQLSIWRGTEREKSG